MKKHFLILSGAAIMLIAALFTAVLVAAHYFQPGTAFAAPTNLFLNHRTWLSRKTRPFQPIRLSQGSLTRWSKK